MRVVSPLEIRKMFWTTEVSLGEEYSSCGLGLLGVCWGTFGRKFLWRVWWRVLQLKNVISLKNTRGMVKGKSLLPKPLRGSTDKKKRGFRFYEPFFFFLCINVCVNFQIHKHRGLIWQMLGCVLPTLCLCVGMRQEGSEEKVVKHFVFHKAERPCPRRALRVLHLGSFPIFWEQEHR